jgi:hypothetical protein
LDPIISKSHNRPFLKALGFSVVINSLMGISGAIGNASGLSGFSYVAAAIASPTAHLIGGVLKPKGPSVAEIAGAGIAALAFSLVFYTMVAWIVLLLWHLLRASRPGVS